MAPLMKYEPALETSIMTRMTKIQTSSCTWMVGLFTAEQDEGDERDAGDAVGFEAVGGGADRVAGIVAGAVGDDARVARIVFLDLEDDLHQVAADVGDLGEDAAGNTQRRRAQRFADGEADEARAGVVAGNEQQNDQHDQQLDADQRHADAHARLGRNGVARVRLALQAGEGDARVGEAVHPDAEPGHAVAAQDADHAEAENDEHLADAVLRLQQHAEVQHDHHRDERPQDRQELALRHQVGLAGFVDQFRHLAHGAVYRQVLELHVLHQREQQPEDAEQDADQQQAVAVHAEELDGGQVGELEAGLAAHLVRRGRGLLGEARGGEQGEKRK